MKTTLDIRDSVYREFKVKTAQNGDFRDAGMADVIANSINKEIGIMLSERDWKLFRKRLPEWQERCMQSLLDEYAAIIAAAESPSTKFWKLEKRLKQDVRRVGVQAEMSRSSMHFNLLCLLNEKVITMSDLDGFSEELVASLAEV